jgi:hypothetical protein
VRIRRRDGDEEAADDRPELVLGAHRGLAHKRLALGKELLDRVEVGRIGRQVEERSPGRGERPADALALCAARLSSTTTLPGRSAGARNCSM